VGRKSGRRSGQDARRLVRRDHEPVAALPDDQLPAVVRMPWRSRSLGPIC
jgi:hypothetical protein